MTTKVITTTVFASNARSKLVRVRDGETIEIIGPDSGSDAVEIRWRGKKLWLDRKDIDRQGRMR